jgi:hypothetical protein
LKKYGTDKELLAKGKLLPVPSNQRMNAYLKEIAVICNIDKTLTTHIARRCELSLLLITNNLQRFVS